MEPKLEDTLQFKYELASGNKVLDGQVYDCLGHNIADYSDEMAQDYLDNCKELDK